MEAVLSSNRTAITQIGDVGEYHNHLIHAYIDLSGESSPMPMRRLNFGADKVGQYQIHLHTQLCRAVAAHTRRQGHIT